MQAGELIPGFRGEGPDRELEPAQGISPKKQVQTSCLGAESVLINMHSGDLNESCEGGREMRCPIAVCTWINTVP